MKTSLPCHLRDSQSSWAADVGSCSNSIQFHFGHERSEVSAFPNTTSDDGTFCGEHFGHIYVERMELIHEDFTDDDLKVKP